MAKIKSRDEELKEYWINYLKIIKIRDSYQKNYLKYKKFINKKIIDLFQLEENGEFVEKWEKNYDISKKNTLLNLLQKNICNVTKDKREKIIEKLDDIEKNLRRYYGALIELNKESEQEEKEQKTYIIFPPCL